MVLNVRILGHFLEKQIGPFEQDTREIEPSSHSQNTNIRTIQLRANCPNINLINNTTTKYINSYMHVYLCPTL